MLIASILVLVALGAVLSTGWMCGYALRRSLLDIPNERSSHTLPTPHGGGVAIVVVVLGGVAFCWSMGIVDTTLFLALAVFPAVVAVIGLIDDHRGVPASVRLGVHLCAAGFVVWLVEPSLSWPVALLAVLAIAWLTNLYNFMDGIDGIAAVEAVTVAGVSAVLLAMNGSDALASVAAIVAAVCSGFLLWNWPPAKIFMGDVGSGFLGFLFGTLALMSDVTGVLVAPVWLILLGVFFVDATWTLIRRFVRGARVYEAHRSHGYQRAARHYGAHAPVTVTVGLINLFWLFPWAALAASWEEWAWLILAIAWLPLCVFAWWFGAGMDEVVDSRRARR